jgi:hypothetical protein
MAPSEQQTVHETLLDSFETIFECLEETHLEVRELEARLQEYFSGKQLR